MLPTLPLTPAQLMRPGIGQDVSYILGDFLSSRPEGRSRPRELWFSVHACTSCPFRREKKLNDMAQELRRHLGNEPPVDLTHFESSDSTDDVENSLLQHPPPPLPPHTPNHKVVTFGTPPAFRKKVPRRKRRMSERTSTDQEYEALRRDLGGCASIGEGVVHSNTCALRQSVHW